MAIGPEPLFEGAFQQMEGQLILLFGEGGPAAAKAGQPGPFIFDPIPAPHGSHDWVLDFAAGRWKLAWDDFTFQSPPKPKPGPVPQSQAAINRALAIIAADSHALLQLMSSYTTRALNAQIVQEAHDIEQLNNATNYAISGLQGQINNLSRGLGTSAAAAIASAVKQANAHSDAVARNVATQLGKQVQQTVGEIHHEAAARAQGDAATLAKADANAKAHADGLFNAANHRMDNLAATEQSDVLNLNNRITSVKQVVEGDISNALAQSEGYATGLVNGLNVPGLRTDVNTLAGTVNKLAVEADQCLTPLCDTVTPNAKQLGNLGGLLKTLESIGVAAVLASLVAEAITDPHTAADAIVTAGGWVDDVAVTLAADVGG